MANCPKCGEHLKLFDWKQKCPHCGANIVLYDLQERLMQDADVAEVQYYHFQKKIDRLKASFVGTKLSIVRIVTSIIPLLAVLLPLWSIKIKDVFDGGISVLTVINDADAFNDEFINALLGCIPLVISVAAFALSVVVLVFHLLLLILACSPKAKIRGYILNGLLIFFAAVSIGASFAIPSGGDLSGKVGIGMFVYLLLLIVNAVVDITVLVKGTPVNHKQCFVGGIPIEEYFAMKDSGATLDEIRAEQYKRLSEIQAQKDLELKEKAEKEMQAKAEVTE